MKPEINLFSGFGGVRSLTAFLPLIVANVDCRAQTGSREETLSPNIIFILADDLGWSSLSGEMDRNNPLSRSDYYETPNIDRLASRGMAFSQGYAPAAISSPSRRSILFGQTPIRQGDNSFPEAYDPVRHNRLTIPLVLKAADPAYRTAHYGKWDIRAGFSPEEVGYDESDGDTGNSQGNNITVSKQDKWTSYYLGKDPKRIETLTARALNFIERNVRENRPFYLQLSHYATHVEIHTKSETYDKFNAKQPGDKHNHAAWAGMLYDLDCSIGRLMAEVDSLGIMDNTYIVFMADNGGVESIPQIKNKMDHPSAFDHKMLNYPLRGGKWVLYEGGIRVPFIVCGPSVQAGGQCDVPVTGCDLLPTFAEMAGYKAPFPEDLDGGSFLPLLATGKGSVDRKTDALFFHRYNKGYPHSAIRKGDYKLVVIWKEGRKELYDLKNDPGELHDMAKQHPDIVRDMYRQMMKYMKETEAEILTSLDNYIK